MKEIDWFAAASRLQRRKPTLLDALRPAWERYTSDAYQATMRPLTIEVTVASPLAGYNQLTLDGLLAWAVVNEATAGNQLDNSAPPYLLPVPLRLEWIDSHTELPLWAANWFEPTTANRKISLWWHKRAAKPEHVRARKGVVKGDVSEVAGRFKEKRIPMPAQIATTWRTSCMGNAEEIARLLAPIDAIGKKRSAQVLRWSISPAESFQFCRYVPATYGTERLGGFPLDMQLAAWTPPYWDGVPECKSLCFIPAQIEQDVFYFVSPHAVEQFQQRVEPLPARQAISIVQKQLNRRLRVIEPGHDHEIYVGWHNDKPFYALMGQGEGASPSVVTILSVESVLHGKIARKEAWSEKETHG